MFRKIIKLVLQYFLGIGLAFVLGIGGGYIYSFLCNFLPDTFFSTLAGYLGSEFYPDVYIMVFLSWPFGLSIGVYWVDRLFRRRPKPSIRKITTAFFAALLGIIFIGDGILPILRINIIIFGLNRELEVMLVCGGVFCLIGYNIADWLWEPPKTNCISDVIKD